MEITEIEKVSEELVEAMRRLVPQLSPTAAAPRREQLEAVLAGGCALFVARDESLGGIVGTLTLTWNPIPSGVRASIEDVVVDGSARGKGVGEGLVRAALQRAREVGAAKVDLTSNPTRESANRLYQRLGFQLRETNAYRFPIETAPRTEFDAG